jgi:hypothetical protein
VARTQIIKLKVDAVSKSHPICMDCKQDVVNFVRLAQYFDTLTHDCRTPYLQHRIPVHFQHSAIHKKSQEPLWSAMELEHNRSRHVGGWGKWRGVKCNDMLWNAVANHTHTNAGKHARC